MARKWGDVRHSADPIARLKRNAIGAKATLMSEGFNFEHLHQIDSTNRFLYKMATSRGVSPTVVTAVCQAEGRGRGSKSFHSPKGGLYFSILIPLEKPTEPVAITVSAALALANVLRSIGLEPQIKWVNDIYLDGKKASGILCEGGNGFAVVGIGVNLTAPKNGFPDDIKDIATAIGSVMKCKIPKKALCYTTVAEFTRLLSSFDEDRADILERYRSLSCLDGKEVTVNDGADIYTATVLGINDDFSLSVKTDEGIRSLIFGDVSLKINR